MAKLFISYSSLDRPIIAQLADDLDFMDGHSVWFDRELNRRGGHLWWNLIIEEIKNCDVFVYALSPNVLQSEPCRREYSWACALGKPVMPLLIADVTLRYLPIALQSTQLMAYQQQSRDQQKALKIALRNLPPAPPLPSPLPIPPTAPLDPVGVLHDKITRLTSNHDEQRLVLLEIDELRDEARSSAEVPDLLRRFMERDDVVTGRNLKRAQELQGLLGTAPPVVTVQPVKPPPRPLRPPTDQERLLALMFDPTQPLAERAKAGRQINQYGDPRPGVLDFSFGADYWCPVPAGTYPLGSDKDNTKRNVTLQAFHIARYPITYAQFQLFIDDKSNGYANAAWWKGLHAEGLDQQKAGYAEQAFKFANHPREKVSWYESMAFCRWLSARLKYEIRLPTEDEWEAAARGTDERRYPYPGDYDPAKGNTEESGIGQTSAVGLFAGGASPCGALDMSGNVWAWTVTDYEYPRSGYLSGAVRRVLRGGSWDDSSGNARSAYRDGYGPVFRYWSLGFRVVCFRP